VKTVHNGIEYGPMQIYDEGFDILNNKSRNHPPEDERYTLHIGDIGEVWRPTSAVSSRLLDLAVGTLAEDKWLEKFTGFVEDSGGRCTVDAAVEEAVAADVLAPAPFTRFRSRDEYTFGEKILSTMRFGFGGHPEHMLHQKQPQ
jgi:6-phosphogluconate dehydrogenase